MSRTMGVSAVRTYFDNGFLAQSQLCIMQMHSRKESAICFSGRKPPETRANHSHQENKTTMVM